MGLLMPLLLGGLAFVGVPWLIHRIRKPTRKPTPFSSLMFVPEARPPVRERKKIEHPWLMLARMIILALLAVAFSRPFTLMPAAAVPEDHATREHVVLVDTSLSTRPRFEELRELALSCLEDAGGGDRVAVVGFDTSPYVVAPLSGPLDAGGGSARGARQAIAALAPSFGATRFIPALRKAEELLRPPGETQLEEDEAVERIIYLVSDLQRTGLPADVEQHALARGISLRIVALPGGALENQAVSEVAVSPAAPATLNVRARLRNFGAKSAGGTLQLWLGGQMASEEPVSLRADSNTVFSLSADADLSKGAAGYVRLDSADVLPDDNTYYFVYEPEPIREIGALMEAATGPKGPRAFLEAAVSDTQPVPWRLAPVEAASLTPGDPGVALPPVLIASELESVSPALAAALGAYVDGGGRLLVIPSPAGFSPALEAVLFAPAGLNAAASRHESIDPETYAILSWIDYESPVFQAFRSAVYSDFSMVRFQNYFRLDMADASPARVVARLESDSPGGGDPAIVSFAQGAGNVVVWAFPLDAAWTNITRTRRFIPLLHETISLLLPAIAPPRLLTVGTVASPPPALATAVDTLRFQRPEETEARRFLDAERGNSVLASTGLVRWFSEGGEEPALSEPVNINRDESDLRAFSEAEFLLRIGAVSRDISQSAATSLPKDQNVVHWEYGYYVLVLLAAAAILESGMAVYYGRRPSREQQPS